MMPGLRRAVGWEFGSVGLKTLGSTPIFRPPPACSLCLSPAGAALHLWSYLLSVSLGVDALPCVCRTTWQHNLARWQPIPDCVLIKHDQVPSGGRAFFTFQGNRGFEAGLHW